MAVVRWADARGELQRAIQLQPHFPSAHVNLGITLCKLDRFDEGLMSFQAVLPEADAYYNLGNYPRAADYYKKITDFHADSEVADWAWYSLGVSRQKKGDHKEAVEAFGNVFKSYPKSSLKDICRFKMGESYFMLGDYENAVTMMTDVITALHMLQDSEATTLEDFA